MRKMTFTLILFIFSLAISAQENKLLAELKNVKGADNQVSYVMNLQIKNLKDCDLKKTLNSELNTIFSCLDSFVNSKESELTEKDIEELKKRTEMIALEFYKSENYVLLKNSGGDGPVYGVGIDTVGEKKIVIVYLGGDCTIDEIDLRREEIISVFNKKMQSLLN